MKQNKNDVKKKVKKSKKSIKINNSEKESHDINENNKPKSKKTLNKKRCTTFLGKKRKLIYYKRHSLQYNELNKLYNKDEILLNINTLYTFTNLNPKLIKGRFAGLLANEENDNDLIIEMNNTDNPKYSRYAIFETKKFGIKLSFLDLSSGTLYLLFKGYAAFLTDEFIKIYFFSHNNTSYDIFQKIFLPDELRNSVLFLFKYVHDDNFYFFNKVFSLQQNNKILLYKYNKDEKENENDYAIGGKPFVEYIYLDFNFEFIWFAQKNDNELLFFYENDFEFKITVYDISKFQVIQQKIIKLNNLNNVKVAGYPNKVVNNRYLPLSMQNFLYIIDTLNCQISTITELDIIEYFTTCDDNTLWTIESKNHNFNNDVLYLRQYKINVDTQELIKIGERKIYKTTYITDNIVHINNKKLVLFESEKKLILFN